MKNRFLIFILLLSSFTALTQTIWTAGPMLHVNFGGEKVRASWGFEVAYWNYSHFPYSFDFCTEFEKKKFRLYSEVQTGIAVAGISAGPVMEIQTDAKKLKFGFQASVWGNYYLGFDVRLRYIDSKRFICPGTYVKVPFNALDENGEKHESSGNHSDWDD